MRLSPWRAPLLAAHPFGALQEEGHLLVPHRRPRPVRRVRPKSLQIPAKGCVMVEESEKCLRELALWALTCLVAKADDDVRVQIHAPGQDPSNGRLAIVVWRGP